MRKVVGIFGGTFDPIHIGHLRVALELKQQLGLDELRLVPCHRPPHRGSQASSAQRLEMLRLALRTCPQLVLDEREVHRDRPSYTFDTLQELRAELGADPSLVLCLGTDAFAGLTSWYRWRELIDLAHILVIARPGWELPQTGELAELLLSHRGGTAELFRSPAGLLVTLELRLLPISATEIRTQVAAGQSAQFLLPDVVWHYIEAQGLYRAPTNLA
jgi:nicotinate-nucleotide adenylyltransferase